MDLTVAVDGDQTVVVSFLEVHVNDTTGPDVSHVLTVQGLDLGEFSWGDLVTAVLGEEQWDGQVSELLGSVLVTGLGVSGVTAPFVHVNTVEVSSLAVVTAGEVVGDSDSGVGVVVRGVTHWDFSVVLLLDVSLGVSDSSLDESGGVGVGCIVGDLVTCEEPQNVGVVGEHVDNGLVTVEDFQVPGRRLSVDGDLWGGQVGDDVDTGVVQSVHTLAVVQRGVNGVDTDNVSVQLLQVRDVSGTSVVVGQWVVDGLATGDVSGVGLVGDTLHVELRTVVRKEELVTNNLNGRQVFGPDHEQHKSSCY